MADRLLVRPDPPAAPPRRPAPGPARTGGRESAAPDRARLHATGRGRRHPARPRILRGPTFGGALGAVVLLCLSTTPSLLPRPWALQALVSGITMLTGYAAGCVTAVAVHRLRGRQTPVPGWAWPVLAATGTAAAGALLYLAGGWQQEVRHLTGMPPTSWSPPLILAAAVGVAAVLLVLVRTVRRVTGALASRLGRWLPCPVAAVAAVAMVATTGGVAGYGGFARITDHIAAAIDDGTAAGVRRPDSGYVSGGPGSLVPWQTLGRHGKRFVAGPVPVAHLAGFGAADTGSGAGARPPVRVYVGLESAPDAEARAELAVRELARTGGFGRDLLVIVSTTGTGWVNPAVVDTLEYLYRGDVATVAVQYSYLPSWVSFLTERDAAAEATAALVTAVGERVGRLRSPAQERPAVLVYGESLGADAVERAFGTLPDLMTAVDAALLVGPPRGPLWRDLTGARDAGTPVWRPVYQGGSTVWFTQDGTDVPAAVPAPRLVYLQHASDPVVWWSADLLWRRPAWLAGDRGPDVSDRMRYYPVVTFWQVTVDLLTSTSVPAGHGHSYRYGIVDAVAALVPPPGWTGADTGRLRAALLARSFATSPSG